MNHNNRFDTNIQSDSECNDCRSYEREISLLKNDRSSSYEIISKMSEINDQLKSENYRLLEEKAKLIEENEKMKREILSI